MEMDIINLSVHSFVDIDHEIFSMVILSLLLIQEGQLSVSAIVSFWQKNVHNTDYWVTT